jgi:hypothetical protein
MPTTTISGKNGSVSIGGSSTYEVSQWSISIDDDLLDGTSFSSGGYKEYVVGLQGATGSMTVVGSTNPPSTASSSAALILQTSTASGSLEITGDAFLQTRGTSVPVDGRVEFTADFTITGTITEGTV